MGSAYRTKCGVSEHTLSSRSMYELSFSRYVSVEFNVDNVSRFEWDDEPFENLVLAKDQKELVKSLVEAQTMDNTGFDDFVKGKGKGLVINLFGNPGVGKSLTAEATSERESTFGLFISLTVRLSSTFRFAQASLCCRRRGSWDVRRCSR